MVKSDIFPTIYNNSNYRVKNIPSYHPESMKFLSYWRTHRRRIFEGCWIPDTKEIDIDLTEELNYEKLTKKIKNNWRWIPPMLYYYINFGTILHKPADAPRTAPKQKITPYLSDFELAFTYNWVEARGFSGFDKDEEYSCNKDIFDFQSGVVITPHKTCYNSNGELKKYIPARQYLRRLSDKPLGAHLYFNQAQNLMLLGSRGGGKDLEENTIIHSVERGRIPIKDVIVGEYIYGADGLPTKVVDRRDFNNQMQYRITIADGRSLIAGSGHLWKVITNYGEEKIVNTADIRDNYKAYMRKIPNGKYNFDSKYFIPINEAIISEEKELLIDPYYLGLWLGDGSKNSTGITTIDTEIKNYIYSYCKKFTEHKVTINENSNKNCPTYSIVSGKGRGHNNSNLLLNKFKNYNLINNKYIPEIYFQSSYNQRLELLKGLMDSDGYICKKGTHIEFSSSIEPLALDVIRLSRSLGIRTEYSTRIPHYKNKKGEKISGKLNYRIKLKPRINVFKLERKAALINPILGSYSNSTHNKIAIRNVEEIGVLPSVCIAVDNKDRLFLAGEYIVTHNSWLSAHLLNHELLTDGSKYYNEETLKNPPMNEVFLGAGIAAKSSDLAAKIKIAMENSPGTWKKGTAEQRPSPLYKHMSGTLQPNNFKNPWRHEYPKKIGGEWVTQGSGSNLKHGVFTSENPEASAGGRYSVIVIEEVGLTSNLLTVHGSNEATQMSDGTDKYGSSLYVGTGGNLEKIIESEIIFRDPEGFNMMSFDDEWENTGKIGWFVPAYYMDRKYKDAEGNTILDTSVANYEDRRVKKKKAKSSSALDLEMMNYPLIPSEMFLNKTRNSYPTADLKHRLAELMTSPKILNATYKGEFYITLEGEIKWKNTDAIPIREFPLRNENMEGCVEMFFMPQRDGENRIPFGRYIAAMDPIDDDSNDSNALSLQSFLIYDLWTEKIVLEYSGRTTFAKEFYEQCRRALIYYNARMLYENQKKGVFTYFDQKNSLYLLEDTPPELRDMDLQKGSTVGNKGKGIYATPAINKWGREQLGPAWMSSQASNRPLGVTNASVQLSVGLIREAIMYSPLLNSDRISAFGIIMIFREIKIKFIPDKEEAKKDSYINDPFFSRTFGSTKDNSYSNSKFPMFN